MIRNLFSVGRFSAGNGLFLSAGLLCVVLAGCDEAPGTSETELRGQVKIDGSSTVYPITEAVATSFGKEFPEVRITVGVSGTGGGFKRFTRGETDISDASRPITVEEFSQCVGNDIRFLELPVAYDGLTIVVSKKNTFVEELTVDQLKQIFREDSAPKTWNEVNADWPEEEMKIFAPGTDSGTFDYFKEVVVGKEKDAAIRIDMSVSEDDHVLVSGVSGEKNGIGFFGAAYYFQNTDKLRAVKIVNPKTKEAVAPTPEAIESGEYAPFSRPLFIYVNAASADRLELREFIEFYLANVGVLAEEVGYVALPTPIQDVVRQHYRERLTGTHFLDEQREKRAGTLTDIYKVENLIDIQPAATATEPAEDQ